LRAAEASLVQSDNEPRRAEMRQLRATLVMLEANAGSNVDLATNELLAYAKEPATGCGSAQFPFRREAIISLGD
jgi:hypothetical protein